MFYFILWPNLFIRDSAKNASYHFCGKRTKQVSKWQKPITVSLINRRYLINLEEISILAYGLPFILR